jgi:DNA-binding MurR/RpiR family transcriptional regulator
MPEQETHPILQRLREHQSVLTNKGKILSDFVLAHPKKVIFMTIKELAKANNVSEATVVRFVRQLGYNGYNQFIQDLREVVDTDITLMDRVDISKLHEPQSNRLHQVVLEGMDNLQNLYNSIDMDKLEKIIHELQSRSNIYVAGSRLAYALAYFMGWSLAKIRPNIQILKGSDSTNLDWLTTAPQNSLVLAFSTTRYPNEMIKLGKTSKRQGHCLVVIADSSLCPLLSFADISLVVPLKNIPLFGDLTIMNSLIRYIILELAGRYGHDLEEHQKKLEQNYLENDIFFNIH